MVTKAVSAEEKEWQAKSDADTLTEAEKIKNDPARYKAAKAKMEEIVKDTQKTLDAVRVALKERVKKTKNNGTGK